MVSRWVLAALALCAFTSARAQSDDSFTYTISTFAGSGAPGSVDGTGTAASFSFPTGAAVDAAGNVFVADAGNNKIRKISPAGVVTTLAGSGAEGSVDGTGTAASFSNPRGAAVDAAGNVFVADASNKKIRKISPAGVVTTLAGSGAHGTADGTGAEASFYYPAGVAVDAAGNVFVADTQSNKIRKISPAGMVTTFAGNWEYGSVDGTGSTARFNSPTALAVDAAGNVFVADGGNNKIRKITPAGVVTTFAGSGAQGSVDGTGTAASFNYPAGVAADVAGNIFVADSRNNKIRRISPAGVVTTLAGSGAHGTADGTGVGAEFYAPHGVAVNAAGNVFVADALNKKIRQGVPRLTQQISFSALSNRTYGDAPFNVSATASSGLTVTISIVSGPATLAGNTVTLTGVGTVTVRASQAGNASYAPAASVNQTFIVQKASQTITFPTIGDRLMTSPTFSLTGAAAATATSGLSINYTVVSGPATLSGTTLTLTGEGVVTVRASQAGNANYAPAPGVNQSFTVQKASQTITWPAIGDRLQGQAVPLSAVASSTLPVTYTVVAGPALLSSGTLQLTGGGPVTLRASQAGNAVYDPVSAEQTFSVRANTASPTNLQLSPAWFHHTGVSGTAVGKLSASDRDTGDVLAYTLVAGQGDTDNKHFRVVGDQLQTSTITDFQGRVALSIRVRAQDLAGNTLEAALAVIRVESNPFVRFRQKGEVFYSPLGSDGFRPGYVNLIFQLKDISGRKGLNFPQDLVDQDKGLFIVQEDTRQIKQSESFLQMGKIKNIPVKARTILLLDTSNSIGASLADIKAAAKGLVDNMFDQQEIAIYTFSAGPVMVAPFTPKSPGNSPENQQKLKEKIDAITLGLGTTNLYGSIIDMLNLKPRLVNGVLDPGWSESFSTDGIESTFLIVMTDGDHTAGLGLTVSDVLAARRINPAAGAAIENQKTIFTVGVGRDLNTAALDDIGSGDFKIADTVAQLSSVFAEVQSDILNEANSFYWANYASPTFGNFSHSLTVELRGNSNQGADRRISTTFSSDGFKPVEKGLYINRNSQKVEGVTREEVLKNTPEIAYAFTVLPPVGTPAYTWSIANPSLATITPGGADSSRVTITPNNLDGTTKLKVRDTVNNMETEIDLVFGSGLALPSQTINFPVIPDRLVTAAPFALSATASSGLPVAFSVPSGPATLGSDGRTLTVTGVGTVTVVATQAGNASYAAAPPVTRTFNVTEAPVTLTPQTITFGPLAPRTFGDAPFDLVATASSGLPVTFSVVSGPATLGANGTTLTLTGAGTVTISATQAGNATYAAATPVSRSFTVTEAPVTLTPQTITFGPLAPRTFGDAPFDLAATASSGLPVTLRVVSGPATLGANGTTLTLMGAGTVTVSATQAGNATYAAATPVTRSFIVSGGTPVDSDEDGVDDAWEIAWFGNLARVGLTTDSDDDGFSDVEEFLRGHDPTAATSVTNQPDALIGFGSKRLLGFDTYDSRGVGQEVEAAVAKTKTKTCLIEIRNGGTARSSFKVSGSAGTANFRVRYMLGTLDVTKKVVAGTFVVKSLPPDKSKILKVLVTVGKKAVSEETFAVNVDLVSDVDPQARDRAIYNVIVK